MFVTGILTVMLKFVTTHMLSRQSKLRAIVANLALQCIKTVEAATIKEINSCNLELIQLLIILNLVLTVFVSFGQIK